MLGRQLRGVVGLAATVTAVACSGAGASTEVTDERSATGIDPIAIPLNVDVDIDWVDIVADLGARKDAAQRNPSLDAVDRFCAPDSPCHDQWTRSIGEMLDEDVRLLGGQPDRITSVTLIRVLDDVPLSEALGVLLDVQQVATEQGTVQLVKSDGSIFQEFQFDEEIPPGTDLAELVSLRREAVTSPWQIFDATKP